MLSDRTEIIKNYIKLKLKTSEELNIIAKDEKGIIMGVSHKKFDLKGIQFHPESIQTKDGFKIVKNFINN